MIYFSKRLTVATTVMLLAACGNDSEHKQSDVGEVGYLSAATLGEQAVLSVSDYLALEQFQAASKERGERQAMICQACHSFDAGGSNMIGPALFDFFGKGAGEQAGFEYSPALEAAEFVWTPRALDAWLAQPGRFLPGNRMAFAGVTKQQDRDDLIAYLLVKTTIDSSE